MGNVVIGISEKMPVFKDCFYYWTNRIGIGRSINPGDIDLRVIDIPDVPYEVMELMYTYESGKGFTEIPKEEYETPQEKEAEYV